MAKSVRIKFSADLVIEGESIEAVKSKWEAMPLWSKEAKDCDVEFSEVLLVEDAETYADLRPEFDRV